jgi:UDP-GlcNAc:undecaprenyl-phosphate GlcNAc-1-phosphate transferase
MTQYLPIIIASAVLAFLVTPVTRWLAHRVGMVDQPGVRKAHRSPTPLLGGLALYVGVTLVFIAFGERDWVTEGIGILGGATLMFATGLWDDRFGMPAKLKLGAAIVAALFLSAFGVRVQLFNVLWLDVALTVLWVVGITHAANLMDNMDGLTAGLAAVAAVFFFVLAALEGQGFVASLAAALLGSALGFLFYNLSPAISFMGDAGALTLGFLLAALGIKIRFLELPLGSTWMAPILVLGVFIFDTTLVTISRLRRGRSPFQGGSDHTSHRLAQIGLGKPRAVLALYVAAATLGALAIVITRQPVPAANSIFGALVLAGLVVLALFERIEPALSGDPPIVLLSNGNHLSEALRTLSGMSRHITVVVLPHTPASAVVEALVLLAEDSEATRSLLADRDNKHESLDLPLFQRALRMRGSVCVADERGMSETIAIHNAHLIVLDVSQMEFERLALHQRIQRSSALKVYIGPSTHMPGHYRFVSPEELKIEVQSILLKWAAGRAKTRLI